MISKYDKAGAAAIGAALTSVLAAMTNLDPEVIAAIGTLVTAGLVWLVPNKAPATK